tara:strand:- start:279 stop:434 length:156 start_codon:yes stop_codon:yes gene_type:complete
MKLSQVEKEGTKIAKILAPALPKKVIVDPVVKELREIKKLLKDIVKHLDKD